MTLIARLPILHLSTQYNVGDELPVNNNDMVDMWISSGAAYWKTAPEVPAKAIPVTDTPGESGISSDADPDAIIGKVPKRGRRKKQ